jgi:hypothetical protein
MVWGSCPPNLDTMVNINMIEHETNVILWLNRRHAKSSLTHTIKIRNVFKKTGSKILLGMCCHIICTLGCLMLVIYWLISYIISIWYYFIIPPI